ncbi:LysR family transcriptional regulator [Endozoicomonas numazuensis]|uniref:HTH lysR-type domain-containing protein n=1 Tax=Endozoicomonas numazuensis TaxID=1137799 RepID=A0A081NG65_9GAMM|nr:LysR family transcriptional regulator [Endozoicomonas numazuensis]KEQ17438.1 hypothetical protein GZ78_16810 [Endozoicomonas numazuensis]
MKFNLKGVDLNLLTVFEAVMETGQLSKAGDLLGMSQPAMSAALQRLRITVDDPLFVRSRQGMEPTPRAIDWYQTVGPALNQIRLSLESRKDPKPEESQRVFTLLAGDYFESVYLAPLLNTLQKEAPGISLNLLTVSADGLPHDFKSGKADFAIHYQEPDDSGLDFTSVGEERLVVITRKNHPRIGEELTVDNYCQERHVIFAVNGQQNFHLDILMGKQRPKRSILARVSHFNSAATIIETTDAICTIPERLADVLMARFAVEAHPFPLEMPAVPKKLIWPSVLAADPLHRWFREKLIQLILSR